MSEFVDENIRRKGSNALDRIEETLFPGEVDIEGTGYDRRMLDRRVEKYLDKHFDEYIEEFGLLKEIDLKVYEEEVDQCEEDVDDLKEFQKDMKDEIEVLEKRLDRIEKEL